MRRYCRWENPHNSRYYIAHVRRDLLGDLVVVVAWGKNGTNLGRIRSIFCETEIKALIYLEKIDRVRIRHGYVGIITEDY